MLPADSSHEPTPVRANDTPRPFDSSQIAQWIALVDDLCDKAVALDAAVIDLRLRYEEAVTMAASFQQLAHTAVSLLAEALAQNSKHKRRIAELLDMGFVKGNNGQPD